MSYQPIDINYEELTIMGVSFPDLETLESAANAIGSNMFEGYEPTRRGIEIIMDKSISPVIAMITPGILSLLIENRSISVAEAADLLYNSQLYKDLEDERTKMWRLGYPLLYDLLEEELTTGKITYPEEQI